LFEAQGEKHMAADPATLVPVLTLQTERTLNQVTVRCSGRLVADTCEAFQQTVRKMISTTKLIMLDFSGVSYIDSSGLGSIVRLHLFSTQDGCQLSVSNLTPWAEELLSMWPEDAFETQFDVARGRN
jgi:anti-anti-sigma factor